MTTTTFSKETLHPPIIVLPPELYETCITPSLPGERCPGNCEETGHCPAYQIKHLAIEPLSR